MKEMRVPTRRTALLLGALAVALFGGTIVAGAQPRISEKRALAIGRLPSSKPASIQARLETLNGSAVWVIEYAGVCTPLYGRQGEGLPSDGCLDGTMDLVIDGNTGEILETFTTSHPIGAPSP